MMSAYKELDKFLDRNTAVFTEAMLNLVRAYYGVGQSIPDARRDLAELIRNTMILADLNGRKRLWMEYDHFKSHYAKFGEIPDTTPIAPNLTFDEAVENLITREPRLAKSAAEVSRMYSLDHVFAMARSAEQHITERAQKAIQKFLTDNTPADALSKSIQEIGNFSQAYADTVYRTNVATAYNEGRMEQAADPEMQDVIVGFRYEGINDARTRDNHRIGFGTIAPKDDPLWTKYRPPNGYNCRCGLEFVSVFEAERLGLMEDGKLKPRYSAPPSQLNPDPGFKGEGLF